MSVLVAHDVLLSAHSFLRSLLTNGFLLLHTSLQPASVATLFSSCGGLDCLHARQVLGPMEGG